MRRENAVASKNGWSGCVISNETAVTGGKGRPVHARNREQMVLGDIDAGRFGAIFYAAREYSLMIPCSRSMRTTSPALGIGSGSGGLSCRLR